MIMFAITGAIGAFFTWKAAKTVLKVREVSKQEASKNPEAWAQAGVSTGWNTGAGLLAGVALYFAFNLSFITMGVFFLAAALALAVGMGARLVRANASRVKAAFAV